MALVLFVVCHGPLRDQPTPVLAWAALSPDAGAASPPAAAPGASFAAAPDWPAIDEMLRGSRGQVERWTHAPELVVLTSVMQFRSGGASEYAATADVLSDSAVDGLVAELTSALAVLTGGRYDRFASVRREAMASGTSTRIIRTNQIVAGRYRGVQSEAGVLGLGGKTVRADGAIAGAALLLDDDYDRTGPMRGRLRAHELGHALGYRHVESRESIMNPRIGSDATALDRRIAAAAYGRDSYAH